MRGLRGTKAKVEWKSLRSKSKPLLKGTSNAMLTASLHIIMTGNENWEISRANFNDSSTRSPGGNTLPTRPGAV